MEYRSNNEETRLTCISCGYIFYENPVVGVAGIVLNDQKQILLGRRRKGPYAGNWCIPCGYVEYYEDVYDAVRRELKEESNLDIEIEKVFTVLSNFHDPDMHSVGIWFFVKIVGGHLSAGDDLDELAYFELTDLPALAFPTDQKALELLRQYLRDKGSLP